MSTRIQDNGTAVPASTSFAGNTTAEPPLEFLIVRPCTLLLNLFGTALCSTAVGVFHKKYRLTRDAFEFGLLLLQWLQVLYCGIATIFVAMDLLICLTQLKDHPLLQHSFSVFYSLTCAALILKNLWTLCVSCFRSAATIRPLAFRTFLTVRFQLVVFSLLLALAVGCGLFSLACSYIVPEPDRERIQISYMLPLIRITQSYIPVFGILATSLVLSSYLLMYRRRARQLNMVTAAGRRSFQRQSARATCIVLCLSLSFTAFEAPGAVVSLMKNLSKTQISVFYMLSDMLISLDSNFNFFVFLALSSNFRAALLCSLRQCCHCCLGGGGGGTGGATSNHHLYASVAASSPRHRDACGAASAATAGATVSGGEDEEEIIEMTAVPHRLPMNAASP